MDYKRQLLLFNPADYSHAEIIIVGMGNIGSHTALTLARMGISELTLYDHDIVEPHNLSSQAYEPQDIGKEKVWAISDKLHELNPEILLNPRPEKFRSTDTPTLPYHPTILLIAVDSMEERKNIHRSLQENNPSFPFSLVIDARIGGDQLEIYCLSSYKSWELTFVERASHDPCGGRFIAYSSVIIGGLISNLIKKHLRREKIPHTLLFHLGNFQLLQL